MSSIWGDGCLYFLALIISQNVSIPKYYIDNKYMPFVSVDYSLMQLDYIEKEQRDRELKKSI